LGDGVGVERVGAEYRVHLPRHPTQQTNAKSQPSCQPQPTPATPSPHLHPPPPTCNPLPPPADTTVEHVSEEGRARRHDRRNVWICLGTPDQRTSGPVDREPPAKATKASLHGADNYGVFVDDGACAGEDWEDGQISL